MSLELLDIKETAAVLKCQPVSLYSRKFLAGLGLRPIKIGSNLRFDRADVERVIESGRKKLPMMPSDEPAEESADGMG